MKSMFQETLGGHCDHNQMVVTNTNFTDFGLIRSGLDPTISTLEASIFLWKSLSKR